MFINQSIKGVLSPLIFINYSMFRPYKKPVKSKSTNRLTSANFYKNTAWKWFSKYMLLKQSKDSICKCVTCGGYKNANDRKMHLGHLFKVFEAGGKTNFSTAFDEKNTFSQCYKCNTINGGEQLKMFDHLVRVYGLESYEQLKKKSYVPKPLDKYTLQEISDEYRLKFNELVKTKGNPWKK